MALFHRPSAWLLIAVAVCTAVVAAQQPPTFRTDIDSVQLDVRVVDELVHSNDFDRRVPDRDPVIAVGSFA